jgi:hypothetical protein
MAGKIISVCPKRSFVFDALGTDAQAEVVLVERLDVGHCQQGDLVVRVHRSNISTGSFYITVVQDAYTPQDPAETFFGDNLCQVKHQVGDPWPTLWVRSFEASMLVPCVAVTLTANQGTAGSALQLALSCDLVLRYRGTHR